MKTLLLVDIQNDFTPADAASRKPAGALAVPGGDEVIAAANRLMPDYGLVVATQDWHPMGHKSFASEHAGREVGQVVTVDGLKQILWPVHCVQGSYGAQLCEGLDRSNIHEIVQKGTDREVDSYSGFYDNGRRQHTRLAKLLLQHGVRSVDVMGLATDYCVKFTAMDALSEGFDTRLILEGCRGVELNKGDIDAAIEEMAAAGVVIVDGERARRY